MESCKGDLDRELVHSSTRSVEHFSASWLCRAGLCAILLEQNRSSMIMLGWMVTRMVLQILQWLRCLCCSIPGGVTLWGIWVSLIVQNPSLSVVTEKTTNGNVDNVLTQSQQVASLPSQMLEKGKLSGESWILLNHFWVVSCTFCSFIFGSPFSSLCAEEQVHSPEPSMVTHCRQCWKGSYCHVISVFLLFSQASKLALGFANRLPCFVFCCFHNTPYELFGKLPLWFFPLTS